jgi:hypothetical protein
LAARQASKAQVIVAAFSRAWFTRYQPLAQSIPPFSWMFVKVRRHRYSHLGAVFQADI